MLVPLACSLVTDASRRGPRGVLNELMGHAGLRKTKATRMSWIRSRYGDRVYSETRRWLSIMGRGLHHQDQARLFRAASWLAKWIDKGQGQGVTDEIIMGMGRWYIVNEPALDKISLDSATRTARDWIVYPINAVQLVPPGELVYRWKDGWSVHRVTDVHALRLEGHSMGNCLRDDSYMPRFIKGKMIFYSIREPPRWPGGMARPVVTIGAKIGGIPPERKVLYLWEVKGRGNVKPIERYRRRTADFVLNYFGKDIMMAIEESSWMAEYV